MSNGRDLTEIIKTARAHYEELKADIANAKDRYEHIRLTALAQSAHNLLTDLVNLDTESASDGSEISQDPLDLPEFKSPYIPPQSFNPPPQQLRLE